MQLRYAIKLTILIGQQQSNVLTYNFGGTRSSLEKCSIKTVIEDILILFIVIKVDEVRVRFR